jgi:hypothetical protein
VTLYIESSDGLVALAAASIVTGWSEPVPGWELHPLKSSAFHGALLRQQWARSHITRLMLFASLRAVLSASHALNAASFSSCDQGAPTRFPMQS